ncbi:hypothetical protein K469DRAFT_695344 [Zopfia rhizophila CBS 207.26]|uniref:Secreted protein n=1 Tax=Zopfia rhizophila CBS 207.26 TaxID=1314779 RepID=A0A6A6DGB6_9PEZI|nr:hypothetical protein K469DRAFT_695344 [Zopfia rhizophila CBS 207.26]
MHKSFVLAVSLLRCRASRVWGIPLGWLRDDDGWHAAMASHEGALAVVPLGSTGRAQALEVLLASEEPALWEDDAQLSPPSSRSRTCGRGHICSLGPAASGGWTGASNQRARRYQTTLQHKPNKLGGSAGPGHPPPITRRSGHGRAKASRHPATSPHLDDYRRRRTALLRALLYELLRCSSTTQPQTPALSVA